MHTDPRTRYLDLVKKTLSFSLWPEPPARVDPSAYAAQPVKQVALRALSVLLDRWNFELGKRHSFTEAQRTNGEIWPGYAYTMIGQKRLDSLQRAVESVLAENVPGDLIETGAWRGGACILMRAVLAAYGIEDRRVFVADSFEGLPTPDAEKYPADRGDLHHTVGIFSVSQEQVEENFRKFDLLDGQVVFLKGWFKDTLPGAPIDRLAVLRVDGDMYESTIQVLETLYPKLSPRGFCVIDDYALAGCRQAVDDFRARQGITTPLEAVDQTGRWWRK
jgi:hypothetical protein